MAEGAGLAGDLGRRSCPRGRRPPRSSPSPRSQKEPDSARWPGRLRTPSASPVSIDSSRVSAAALDHLAVGDQLVAGLDPDDVAGDDLVGADLDDSPSRIALALGATSSARLSSVSFAFSSWRMPM